MRKYRLIIINGFQEPELVGEYNTIEELLLAFLMILKTHKAIMVEIIEVK
ncbi:MAG: hypothetical protein QW182_04500 [Thermosphaera sp.]